MYEGDVIDLKPYQVTGANWLVERERAILADEPGLGKTRTALYAARWGVRASRVLVLGPAVARGIWEREFDRVYDDAGGGALMFESYPRFAMSASARDAADAFAPEVVILDEFHYLKHEGSKRSRAVLGPTGLISRLPAGARRWALSGTPAPRNALELWPIARGFWPREVAAVLGIASARQWLDRFCVWYPGDYGPRIVGVKNAKQLRAFFRGKMLRRTARAVLPDLPAIRWTVDPLAVSDETANAVEDAYEAADEDARRRVVVGPPSASSAALRHAIGDLKAPVAADLIANELADGRGKRVVFAYHRSVLDALQSKLAPFGVERVDGSVGAAERALAEYAFQNSPDRRVFLGQIEAAGVSLTLTAAHRVDIVEPDWRTDFNVQAGKRVYRIGQGHPVWVRMLSMAGTLDHAIVRQHHREVKMVEGIVDND